MISILEEADKLKKVLAGHGAMLKRNEMEDIIKLIKSIENRVILLKATPKKVMNQKMKIPSKCSWSINESWFTINEKCTYTVR